MLAVCGVAMLLAACGIADKNSALPAFMRQSADPPPPPEVEPDAKEVIRSSTLFTTRPSALSVSHPRRLGAHRFGVCVKALTPAPIDGETRAVTLFVSIEHGKMLDRRRAGRDDHCETEIYEKVELAQ
jgi:hypothetical protein